MKAMTTFAAAGVLLLSMSVEAQNSQQDKMKTCLSNQPAAESKLTPQQQKMKQCNADAKARSLSGSDRKTFMSTCLKG